MKSIDTSCYEKYTSSELGGLSPETMIGQFSLVWERELQQSLIKRKLDLDRVSRLLTRLILASSKKAMELRQIDKNENKQKELRFKKVGLHRGQKNEISPRAKSLNLRKSLINEIASYLIFGEETKHLNECQFKSIREGALFVAKLLCLLGLDITDSSKNEEGNTNQKFLELTDFDENGLSYANNKTMFLMLLNERAEIYSQSIRKSLREYNAIQTENFYKGFFISSKQLPRDAKGRINLADSIKKYSKIH